MDGTRLSTKYRLFSPSLPAGGGILVQPSLMGSLFSFCGAEFISQLINRMWPS
jgi:hypothetical protein